MLTNDDSLEGTTNEQVSLVLGPNYVLTFQERERNVFDPVRERLRKSRGKIRKMGADYLTYSLLDTIVDHYFMILEKFGDRMEAIEGELLGEPGLETLHSIHALKQQGTMIRRSIWPMREVIGTLARSESPLIQDQNHIYFRDVYDHTIQVIDSIETLRDTVSSLADLYLSTISIRMNEVMKVLTIIATIFIPLTFVAGVYGMNFENMPELEWEMGYFGVLLFMGCVTIAMIGYFKKKKWI